MHQKLVTEVDRLGASTTREIEKAPFLNLLAVMDFACFLYKRPYACHLIWYLSEKLVQKKGERKAQKAAHDELFRLFRDRTGQTPLFFRAREHAVDSTHDGTHFHYAIFLDKEKQNQHDRLKECLRLLQERGYLAHYHIAPPKHSMHCGQEVVNLKNSEQKQDAKEWLSYICKAETKPKGRNYSYSQLPEGFVEQGTLH
jgi:hypothetical protein